MGIGGELRSAVLSSIEWNGLSVGPSEARFDGNEDLLCFSHVRWALVGPFLKSALMRYALQRRVFYVEEPRPAEEDGPRLWVEQRDGVYVVEPRLPMGVDGRVHDGMQRKLVEELFTGRRIGDPILWFHTPATTFAQYLMPQAVVDDGMD